MKVEHSGRRRPLISLSVVAAVGILLSIIGGVVMHLLWLYLTGIVIAAVSLASIVVRMTSPTDNRSRLPARVGALVTVLVLAGAAITVPWLMAKQQRSVQTQWSGAVASHEIQALTTKDRLLFQDRETLRALDLESGQELWSDTFEDTIQTFYTSDDGHVLVLTTEHAATWLDPDGEELWTRGGDEEIWPYSGYTSEMADFEPRPWVVVAAQGETVVMQRCHYEHQWPQCTFRGIDATGEENFEWDAPYAGPYTIAGGSYPGSALRTPSLVLPPVFLTTGDQHDGLDFVAADTGEPMGSTGVALSDAQMPARPIWLDEDVVVQQRMQSKSAYDSVCKTSATRSDGSQLWTAKTFCLDYSYDRYPVTFVPGRIYGYELNLGLFGGSDVLHMMSVETGDVQEFTDVSTAEEGSLPPTNGYEQVEADVVFKRDDDLLRGLDPDTGEEKWAREAPELLKHGDGTAVGITSNDSLNPFVAEDETVLTLIDAQSGEDITSVLVPPGSRVAPVGKGQALVWQDGQVRLIGG